MRRCPLAKLLGTCENLSTVAKNGMTEQQPGLGRPRNKAPQLVAAVFNRRGAKVHAAEKQQVEGEEGQPTTASPDRTLDHREVGTALFVKRDHLAVDDGRLATEPFGSIDHTAVVVGPVEPVAGECARCPSL